MSHKSINELCKEHRKKEMQAICRFIDTACIEDVAYIIEEIRICHDNLLTFNPTTKLLAGIEGVCINGKCIQLNIKP